VALNDSMMANNKLETRCKEGVGDEVLEFVLESENNYKELVSMVGLCRGFNPRYQENERFVQITVPIFLIIDGDDNYRTNKQTNNKK
jgi:hypothetical protein